MNINIYAYINANHLVEKGFKVKFGISKLALRGTQTKAISPSASYATHPMLLIWAIHFKSLVKYSDHVLLLWGRETM